MCGERGAERKSVGQMRRATPANSRSDWFSVTFFAMARGEFRKTVSIRAEKLPGKLTRTCAVAAVASALSLGAVASPAQAAGTDPEQTAAAGFIGSGSVPTGSNARLLGVRALTTSLAANAAMAAKLPLRAVNAAIGSNYAMNVVDISTGETIWSRRATDPMLPASNMKLVTAVNALEVLGPDRKYKTEVFTRGRGKIVIRGSGDATLSHTAVKRLARQASRKIVANPDLIPPLYTPAPYRPSTCTINGKKVKSRKKRKCPIVTPGPQLKPLKIFVDDSIYPRPTRPDGWRSGYEPSVVRPVRALGIDGRYVMDSGADTASYLSASLRKGLTGKFAGRRVVQGDAQLLAEHLGATVYDQVRYMLQPSENNIAEMLFRNVAVAMDLPATWEDSRAAAMKVLDKLGIPTESLFLADGSGVSRDDRLTPLALTTILEKVADVTAYPQFEAIYYGGGMPLAGKTGTLSARTGRFTTRPTNCAAGLIRAKTGTLFDTIGLSGLTAGSDGQLKAFSILVNSRPGKYSPLQTRRRVDRLAATVNGCF